MLDADLFVVNRECCISDRGERVRDPEQGFFVPRPPVAAERLAEMGVTCVTLANNHVLDLVGGGGGRRRRRHERTIYECPVGATRRWGQARPPRG